MSAPNYGRPSREIANWLTSRAAGFFRGLASLGIALSFYLFAAAAHDEQRGMASVVLPAGRGDPVIEIRTEHPEQFHNLMVYQWVRASLVLFGALVIRGMCRRADRTDPFSPDFAGKESLDECERKLDAELKKYHSPLRW